MDGWLGPSIQRLLLPIILPLQGLPNRCFDMTNRIKVPCARAGASAIAAALALSPIHATVPKPIVDLSKSPALSGKAAPVPSAKPAPRMIGPFDERTAEFGGGAIALVVLGAGAFAFSRRRRHEDAEWQQEPSVAEPRDPLFDEPMFQQEPTTSEESAFAWGASVRSEERGADVGRSGKTWVERAYRGPTPDNPSLSLRVRLKRAAFFDKREREAAAGKAAPVDADAGLPETMREDRELEGA
jgi:hypothetical protein